MRIRTVVVLPAPLGPSMPRTVPGGTCRSTPCQRLDLPEPLGEALDDDRRIAHGAGHPTHDVNPPLRPSPSCGSEPVRHADPPLAHVVGTLPHDVETAVGPRTHRNAETFLWVGAGSPGSTSAGGRGSAAPDRRHDPLLARFEPPDRGRVDPQAAVPDVLVGVRQPLELVRAARARPRPRPARTRSASATARERSRAVGARGASRRTSGAPRPRAARDGAAAGTARSTAVASAASVWVPGTRGSGSAPAGGRKCRIARNTAYPMAANTRNPSIRCQISGGPAWRWFDGSTRRAVPEAVEAIRARDRGRSRAGRPGRRSAARPARAATRGTSRRRSPRG